jgi:hypothetical protein
MVFDDEIDDDSRDDGDDALRCCACLAFLLNLDMLLYLHAALLHLPACRLTMPHTCVGI